MDNRRFSLEEFAAMFPGRFESQDELLREYKSFLTVFDQLDRMPVSELSDRQKAEIFRASWQGRPRAWSWVWSRLDVFRRPAVTFAMGIALGCAVMFGVVKARPNAVEPVLPGPIATADKPLTIEQVGGTQVYKGEMVERLHPQIENARIVIEKTKDSATPQRVLYGTLDDGEVYVVWNL